MTFETKLDASNWLTARNSGEAVSARPSLTLDEFAADFLKTRDLKPRTRLEYQRLYDTKIKPMFGTTTIFKITPALVRQWFSQLDATHPTRRAHAYSLLRTMLNAAVADDLIDSNPCRVRGAGVSHTRREITVATLNELEVIVANMPVRLQPMVLLAAWCGLRFGELAGLTRADLDLAAGTVAVRRAVVRVPGEFIAGTPKSAAGSRIVAIPPHLIPALQQHLDAHVLVGDEAPVFSRKANGEGGVIPLATLHRAWWPAREAAGRKDLRFHDLRHTGATLAAATGATLADLMARIGHSTPGMALRYQHTVAGRDQAIAERLSGMAASGGVPLGDAGLAPGGEPAHT